MLIDAFLSSKCRESHLRTFLSNPQVCQDWGGVKVILAMPVFSLELSQQPFPYRLFLVFVSNLRNWLESLETFWFYRSRKYLSDLPISHWSGWLSQLSGWQWDATVKKSILLPHTCIKRFICALPGLRFNLSPTNTHLNTFKGWHTFCKI